ncbi:MAG: trigger factor [Ginsengibacter sp.]|jgi:trigger factor
MASVTKESIGNLHDKVVVKVSKEDYFPAFEKAMKDYSKKANIPGFRKGMVPVGMVKKMYGASIFYDEVIRRVEKELQQFLSQEKPEIFAQPLPMENDLRSLDMNNPADYEFPFEMGLKPELTLDVLNTAKTIKHEVAVTKEMLDEEIEKMVLKNGELQDVESVSGQEDVINVLFEESDAEGNVTEGGISKDNSILLKYFTEEFQQKLQGKKVDDSIVVQLNTAFSDKEREWIFADLELDMEDKEAGDKYFKMTISKIGSIQKKELNPEFFKLVFPALDLQTEEEFRKALEEEIQKQWNAASRNQLHDQIYHSLLETPIEFPETFLKRWLEIGGEKAKTKEEVEEEFPTFINQLKWTLFSDKIIIENNLEVTEEALREGMKTELMRHFGQLNLSDDNTWIDSYIDQMMKDEKQVDSTYRKMITEKLFEWLETKVTPETKKVSMAEFSALSHNHSH